MYESAHTDPPTNDCGSCQPTLDVTGELGLDDHEVLAGQHEMSANMEAVAELAVASIPGLLTVSGVHPLIFDERPDSAEASPQKTGASSGISSAEGPKAVSEVVLKETLGAGGMGTVYSGTFLGIDCAVKVLKPAHVKTRLAVLFRQEVRPRTRPSQ
jgi:hypothetical protein